MERGPLNPRFSLNYEVLEGRFPVRIGGGGSFLQKGIILDEVDDSSRLECILLTKSQCTYTFNFYGNNVMHVHSISNNWNHLICDTTRPL